MLYLELIFSPLRALRRGRLTRKQFQLSLKAFPLTRPKEIFEWWFNIGWFTDPEEIEKRVEEKKQLIKLMTPAEIAEYDQWQASRDATLFERLKRNIRGE